MTHASDEQDQSFAPDRRGFLGVALVSSAAVCSPVAAQGTGFEGVWNGVLRSGSITLRLQLNVGPGNAATLTSVDENEPPRPASSVTIRGDEITVAFGSISASFEGRLANERLEGRWRQLFHNIPIVFTRAATGAAGSGGGSPALTADRLVRRRREAQIPALGAAWRRADGRQSVLVDGLRSTRSDVRVEASDRWHLGSVTKSMTATIIARYVAAGVLSWDDTAGGVLGQSTPDMRQEYRSATLRELLSHRSGLQANLGAREQRAFVDASGPIITQRLAFAREALRQRPAGPPRDTFLYSNNGYVVAAAMLETRIGMPWEVAAQRSLFEPLGLASAGFGPPGSPGAVDEPLGHFEPDWNWEDGRPRRPVVFGGDRPMDNVTAMGPAGRVHMNLGDLLTYLEAHAREPASLLAGDDWRRLHTPPFGGDYALGWTVRNDGTLWHNGSNTYWYAEVCVQKAQGVVAAAVANDGVEDVTFPAVGETLLEAVAAARA